MLTFSLDITPDARELIQRRDAQQGVHQVVLTNYRNMIHVDAIAPENHQAAIPAEDRRSDRRTRR